MEALWQPLHPEQSQMHDFVQYVNKRHKVQLANYHSLHHWSIEDKELFWQCIWDYCGVIANKPADTILTSNNMKNCHWFQGAELNFAQNLLRHAESDQIALHYVNETGYHESISYQTLYQRVTKLAVYFKQLGIESGDRVVGFLPNSIDTVIAMLATTSLGAVWSACSPDFGLHGLLDRFGQIKPKLLLATDRHIYNGKSFEHHDTVKQLQTQLPSLIKTLIVPYDGSFIDSIDNTDEPLDFVNVPFEHPLYILFSSGTTGKPKCMVHGVGGTLLQHLKELTLHCDLTANDTLFFFTSCGWMMWNWLVSSLATGATLVLYEGSPFHPNKNVLFDLVDKLGITVMGVGAKILEAAENFHLNPKQTHSLKTLRTILTTGSPLLPESFDYVYRDVKNDVQLSSISGGSDIISCFALGNPMLPVYRGELQCIGLGMDVHVFDKSGQAVTQQRGELVCTSPFPSMPIYFWNDPDGKKYHDAYFNQFPNVWTHGDFAEITEHGGLIISGRSDATLNPGGIRIGTADLYNVVNQFEEVTDSLAVDQAQHGKDEILLFIVLQPTVTLSDALIMRIKQAIREQLSPHHVPAKVFAVPDLPRTLNGKLVEIAVKKTLNHQPITNLDALANPESLEYFKTIR